MNRPDWFLRACGVIFILLMLEMVALIGVAIITLAREMPI